MTYPAVIFWFLFLKAAVSRQQTLLLMLFASFTFGSLAVLPPEVTAGSSFVPKTMFALLLVMKVLVPTLLTRSSLVLELASLKNLGFLFAFLAVSLITTIFVPSFLADTISVVPLKSLGFASTEPLRPSQGNITQSIYLSVSVAVAAATALIARSPPFPGQLLLAVLVGGITLLTSGLIDMFASAAGLASLLDPFRNAGYAMITNAEVLGVRRVVGLMPEASSYGSSCVAFASALAFLRPLYAPGPARMVASSTAVALIGMALLSTSSSAYAGLAIFSVAYAINLVRRIANFSAIGHTGLAIEFVVGLIAVVSILMALLLQPELFDPLLRLVDEIIFNKAMSNSFVERSFWNQVGWNALFSSYGLGVGLGATRASNYFVAVISNTGLIGGGCFFIFLLQTMLRRSYGLPQSRELVTALKFTIIPSLGMAALGSATPDFEPWLAIIFGAITGISLQSGRARSNSSRLELLKSQPGIPTANPP